MILDAIQAQLVRLQVHPVNLSVVAKDERLVELRGSLLQYWKVRAIVDGPWLLGILRDLPDTAGPAVVMSALRGAQASHDEPSAAGESGTALRLFDPHKGSAKAGRAGTKKGG